ncbi:Nitric oxide-responding transcriptional regulator Dnr (Crp/Fnr family) [hydrothermal vent metagenome]|uniref:Nitric oxide-responding transcriptional regulator Dnr (Crp/Fnr family) n=1 Tax=hydrothermal vent metagenome TaxID=652676 RepID=A0A1W1C647_9ZZZZ
MKDIAKIVTIAALLVSGVAMAKTDVNSATPESKTSISKEKMIDMAGRQRMLSQRVAKDYFYLGKKINKGNAKKQLDATLREFKKTQDILSKNIKDEEISNLIAFVNMSLDEFNAVATDKYSIDNGTIILDLSESMLEGSDYVVQALKKGKETNAIIDIAGKQRMLSQRIAKYYIAYQAGIKDDNTITQMRETVKEFDDALNKLLANKENTKEIQDELNKVNKMWKIVYKFYLNIEKGGLPIIVFTTTDDITKNMNKIVKMYVEILEKK